MTTLTSRQALLLVLDHVDYTAGACGLAERVGACLPKEVIAKAREALATPDNSRGFGPLPNLGDVLIEDVARKVREDDERRRLAQAPKTIFFNSGRWYTEKGQRIGAQLMGNGAIIFTDVDRNIDGCLTPEVVEQFALKLDQASVMWGYDHHEVTQYWVGLTGVEYEAAVRQLREATRAKAPVHR